MEKIVKYNYYGKCAVCGSESLEYKAPDIDGEYIFFPFICEQCGNEGYEECYIEYQQTIGYIE